MGKAYRRTYRFLEESAFWSAEQWNEYQGEQLRQRLIYARENVPFYRGIISEKSVRASSNVYDEIQELPLLTKDDVRRDFDDFVSSRTSAGRLYETSTGGTTGKPLRILYDSASYHIDWAYKIFFWNLATGYKPSDRKATFRGVSYGDKLWIANPIYNEVRFSPFRIDDEHVEEIIKFLAKYRPAYIHGYPSALTLLSKYYRKLKVAPPSTIRGVFLISENFSREQRDLLESVFGAPTYSFYGHSERLVMASMCDELDDSYHVHPAYGFLEIVNEAGDRITEAGVRGEIVGTGFINSGQVILRYRTGDYASWIDEPCKCGRSWSRISIIEGRWLQEHLIGQNQELVSLTALNMHSDVYEKLQQMQFYQDEPGVVQLNVVSDDDFTKEDEQQIIGELGGKLGAGFRLEVKQMKRLHQTQAGKTPYLIQKID